MDKAAYPNTVDEVNLTVEKQLRSGNYQHVVCNLCGKDDAVFYAIWKKSDRLHIRRVRCRHCGFVYSDPQATSETLMRFYDTCYKDEDVLELVRLNENEAPSHRKYFTLLAQRMSPGRFLDIGCSTGHILSVARDFGWNVYGVDVSPSVVGYARETLGLDNVQQTDLFRAHYQENFFDFVFMWHVLEHMSDPSSLLVEIHRVLKPGGTLRIGVPCLKDPMYYTFRMASRLRFQLPEMASDGAHTCEFTPSMLRMMLENIDFTVVKKRIYYNPIKSLMPKSGWKRKTVIYFFWYLAKILPNWFGHRLEMEAVKRR